MLVKVTLPVLLTVPEKTNDCPGPTGTVGHTLVTLIPGVVTTEQVTPAELVTVCGVAVNWSTARATRVAVLGLQASDGTQLPLKEATCPIARLVGKRTVVRPLLTKLVTVTPTSVLLPQFVTVPVNVIAPFSPTPPRQTAVILMHGRLTSVFTPWLPPPRLSV